MGMPDVRRLRKGDGLDGLIRLSREFFEEYSAYHEEFFRIGTLRDSDIIDYFSSFVDRDDRAAFVASSDGKETGYITVLVQTQPAYWSVGRVGHISGLMVGRESRRKGIATRLLEEAGAFFAEHGIGHYTVSTAVANRQALEFYAGHGLEPLQTVLLGTIRR
jgi:ribosomal protein S18 acetylase RimI-like enzyme